MGAVAGDRLAAPRTGRLRPPSYRTTTSYTRPVPALAAISVSKRYGATEALRGVDLEVREGELFGLLAPMYLSASASTSANCGRSSNCV